MQPALAIQPEQPKPRKHRAKALMQIPIMQTHLQSAIALCREDMNDCQDREVRARIGSALASMVRGWDILEERKRILRGRPLPGHLRPDLPASQRKQTRKIALLASSPDEDKESLSDSEGGGSPTR